ncbi:dienelactone hydrolase family protein [Fundicoccus sp. Sow4_H7]|uniref:dienelactone hydrolase family protein n=1 Tax=Fundicoccus sp. Sow4_H7 TaxID=3438784 RepID=UPI003F91A925
MKEELWELLGDLPEHHTISSQLISTQIHPDGYCLENWLLDLNGEEEVPAYIAKPLELEGKAPLVLVNHSHGGMYAQGKEEFITPSHYLQKPSYAKTLTDMGYIAASIDMWCFGERERNESDLVKEMLWRGRVVWGLMLYDNMRFLDFLTELEEVDEKRIATIGMSMGGLQAWWLSALDERIKVTVDMGGQVDAQTLLKQGKFSKHGFYSYVPGLLKHFSTTDIQSMIAPRKRLSLVGRFDGNCPLEGIEILDKHLTQHYRSLGASENWQSRLFGCGHKETAAMRKSWVDYLQFNL